MLVRITDEVDTERQVGDYMYKSSIEGGPALLFENVISRDLGIKYDMPLVGALICTRERAAIAIGCTEDNALNECIRAQQHPVPPVILERDPIRRKVIRGGTIDLLKLLPVAKCSPKDGGKYIGTAVGITKDPEFGRNISISRHQVIRRNRLGIESWLPQHTAIFRARADERGEDLKITLALGCAPDIVIASQFKPPIGVDELSFAGALRGEPVKLVKGITIDNEFPVSSHVVIEGVIPKDERDREGPFGEYTGYYGDKFDDLTVIDVTALIIREDIQPIFYGPLPMPVENDVIKELPMEASILFSLRKNSPQVKQVRCPWYGGSEDFVIVQIKKTFEDEGKVAILGTFGATGSRPKIVIVVDDDVDIFNEAEVLNALTYRMQPGKDVTIVRTQGNPLDPSYIIKSPEGGYCIGFDATKPLGKEYTEKIEDHRTSREIPKPKFMPSSL
jgi:2,5-furandicarboxylate decarboxylase 1